MNKITDNLWIGDIQDAQTKPLGEIGITHVVTVCQDDVGDNVGGGYDHFNMADGDVGGLVPGDNSYELFAEAVDRLRELWADSEVVFCHCHKAQSRSVCVSAAAIAVEEDIPFEGGLEIVDDINGSAPAPLLVEHGDRYVSGSKGSSHD